MNNPCLLYIHDSSWQNINQATKTISNSIRILPDLHVRKLTKFPVNKYGKLSCCHGNPVCILLPVEFIILPRVPEKSSPEEGNKGSTAECLSSSIASLFKLNGN